MAVRNYTTRHLISPMERWEVENTLKIHLSTAPPPSAELDLQLVLAQIKFTKISIRALEDAMFQIRPRRSYELEAEVTRLYVVRQDLGCKLFPINSLPVELLNKIFRSAILDPPFATSEERMLAISWVCRRWRAVTLADSTLWGSLQFKDPPNFERTLTFMQRAGNARLDVRIIEGFMSNVDGMPYQVTAERMNALMNLLQPKASQIRKLIVYVSDPASALIPLVKLRNSSLTSLERFDLRRTGEPTVWAPPPAWPPEFRDPNTLGNGDLPQMTFLILGGISIDWSRTTFRNLRQLELYSHKMSLCPTPQQWCRLLEACPTLYKISLDGSGPQWDWPSLEGVRKVRLPLLRELIIGTMSLRFIQFVITYLDAPGLMDLMLFELDGEDYGPLIQMLIGRFPKVVLLSLYNVEIFSSTPNLSSLVLWLDSMPKVVMLKLTQFRPILSQALLQDPREFRENKKAGAEDAVDADATPVPREWPDETQSERPMIVCPELKVLQFTAPDQNAVVTLVGNRHTLGAPFRSVYVQRKWMVSITPESFKALETYAMRFLTIEETGWERAPEEEMIHRDMSLSSPGPSIYKRT